MKTTFGMLNSFYIQLKSSNCLLEIFQNNAITSISLKVLASFGKQSFETMVNMHSLQRSCKNLAKIVSPREILQAKCLDALLVQETCKKFAHKIVVSTVFLVKSLREPCEDSIYLRNLSTNVLLVRSLQGNLILAILQLLKLLRSLQYCNFSQPKMRPEMPGNEMNLTFFQQVEN